MKLIVDTHTHTISSGHAYSTLLENIHEASLKGIKILGVTDHGPAMPGSAVKMYFNNLHSVPREISDVIILRGCELNIVNFSGKVDLPERIINNLDLTIASYHDAVIQSKDINSNTEGILKVMDNPYVDILGHIGNPVYPLNYEEIVKKAKDKDVIIEINSSSTKSRPGSYDNCVKVAKLCKEYGVKIAIGSDAHISFSIGSFDKAIEILKEANVPEELVMNTDDKKIINYLIRKGKLIDLILE